MILKIEKCCVDFLPTFLPKIWVKLHLKMSPGLSFWRDCSWSEFSYSHDTGLDTTHNPTSNLSPTGIINHTPWTGIAQVNPKCERAAIQLLMYLVYSRQHQERWRCCPFHPENGVPPEISKKLSGERGVQRPLPFFVDFWTHDSGASRFEDSWLINLPGTLLTQLFDRLVLPSNHDCIVCMD